VRSRDVHPPFGFGDGVRDKVIGDDDCDGGKVGVAGMASRGRRNAREEIPEVVPDSVLLCRG